MSFLEQEEAIKLQIELVPGIERLRELDNGADQLSGGIISVILAAAAQFAQTRLAPINAPIDRTGCRLINGRVIVPKDYHAAIAEFISEGWPGMGALQEWGGQELPLILQVGCQELFDRGCTAFGMLPGLWRSASRVLEAHASEAIKAEWLPKLASGQWCATICISESDAGSDVGRLKSTATQKNNGTWSISGEKIWISFGDHDLAERIGHCVLARTAPKGGTSGLSLFLVPDCFIDVHGETRRNAIVVRRIEEKLGLHGSPTCALGFENSDAFLIGQEGRGLQALFSMIGSLRLSVATQSLGIASGALNTAVSYAAQRRQGGSPSQSPVAIAQHPDVQRMLLEMTARVEVIRGLTLTLAAAIELSEKEPDSERRHANAALTAWLLPIVKTLGADTAFHVSHEAIQVLGGAGYTREWPLEQQLRDARVFSIYEGTSGMQALDLLHRRLWRDQSTGLDVFLNLAYSELELAGETNAKEAAQLTDVLEVLKQCAKQLNAWPSSARDAEAGALAFLHLAGLAATSWIALRLSRCDFAGTAAKKLQAAGRFWLSTAPSRARCLGDEILLGEQRLAGFADIARAFE